jgi:hypothetical protein
MTFYLKQEKVMSQRKYSGKTVKGSKGPGYEYWSKRAGSFHGAPGAHKFSKRLTHKLERLEGRRQCREIDE